MAAEQKDSELVDPNTPSAGFRRPVLSSHNVYYGKCYIGLGHWKTRDEDIDCRCRPALTPASMPPCLYDDPEFIELAKDHKAPPSEA